MNIIAAFKILLTNISSTFKFYEQLVWVELESDLFHYTTLLQKYTYLPALVSLPLNIWMHVLTK